MQRNGTTRRGVLTGIGAALVTLAGCSNTDQGGTPSGTESGGLELTTETDQPTETVMEQGTESDTDPGTSPEGDAMLRVAHLAPDAPNVDVAVDGTTVRTNVSFETVSEYRPLTAGEHRITATPTGGSNAVFDETVSLERGPQTAVAIGEMSGENQSFTVALLTDDDATAEPGSTRVRTIHTIPDAPDIDVTAGGTVIADNVAFGEAGSYVTVPADTGSIELRPNSLGNDAEPVATFSVDLTDTAAQTAFAVGYLDPAADQPGARLVIATDADGTAGRAETETATPVGGA